MPRDLMRAADVGAAPGFRRGVVALHQLGARATAECIAELILMLPADRRQRAFDRLAVYRGIRPEQLAAAGGDRFSAIPFHAVEDAFG